MRLLRLSLTYWLLSESYIELITHRILKTNIDNLDMRLNTFHL